MSTTQIRAEQLKDTFLTGSGDVTHNDVDGLQGGTTDEYYHLTSAEHGRRNNHIITLGVAGALTISTGTTRVYAPWNCTITNVRAMVGVAPTGDSVIVDVHLDGTTIFSTQGNRPTIAASGYTDLSSTPDTTSVTAGSYFTIDVDQVGSTIAGSNLIVMIEVTL